MNQSVPNTHRTTFTPLTIALALGLAAPTLAEPVSSVDDFFQPDGMTATAENYPTLETSRQLLIAQGRAAVNEFAHNRQLTPTDDQPVVRMNRDTYYSFAVVDVSAGASITIRRCLRVSTCRCSRSRWITVSSLCRTAAALLN